MERHRQSIIGLLVVVLLLLSACADGAREASARSGRHNFSSPLPAALSPDLQTSTIQAWLQIDSQTAVELKLNWKQGYASTQTGTLEPGPHDFVIRYVYQSHAELLLASASQNEDVSDPANVEIHFQQWTYADDDGDGYTNLAELRLGTDWWDGDNTPPRESLRASGNYVLRDRVGTLPLSGNAQSPHYTISD